MAATIRDVARHAKVSVASVSRALSGKGVVTPATRERILRAAEKLHYVPDAAARTLSTKRTQTVGVLLPDIYGEFFSELVRGIDAAARGRGLHLLVTSSHGDAFEATAAIRAMTGRIDGLLIMSPYVDAEFLGRSLHADVPAVLMNTREQVRAHASLTVDNHGGAFALVSHLAQIGHRRIAHITGPENNFDAQERLRGYRAALGKLRPAVKELLLPGDFSEESGYEAGRLVITMDRLPDAIFAANDMTAIGCLFALTESGVKVPGDIALAGFDDIPIARFVTPPLTTMRVDSAALGRRALEHLISRIDSDGKANTPTVVLKPELVVRVSCGATGARRRRGDARVRAAVENFGRR